MSWIECVVDRDYEIFDEFPYDIRRKGSDKNVKESEANDGYIVIHLNQKKYLKHRVVAQQFILNPDNLPFIDHIDRDRTNYHISNLRWVSSSENCKNKSSQRRVDYDYVDEIPNDSIIVDSYSKWQFEDLFYHENVFYFFNGIQYRILHINEEKNGSLFVYSHDVDDVRRKICYSKFKKEYGLS